MKKAKIFKGMKIKINFNLGEEYEDLGILNIPLTDLKKWYEDNKDHHSLLWDVKLEDIKILENNLQLYEVVSCKPEGDVNILMNFRVNLKSPNCYNNSRYLTKEEIAEEIENGYVIAVRGLKEIDSVEEL